jgi:transcriptional regulator with XRE-family HTH domain
MSSAALVCKTFRINRKLTIKEAATRIHVDHRRISNFEHGFDTLTFGEVENLAKLLDCDLIELLCTDPETLAVCIPKHIRTKFLNILLSELLQQESLPDVVRVQLPAIFRKLQRSGGE